MQVCPLLAFSRRHQSIPANMRSSLSIGKSMSRATRSASRNGSSIPMPHRHHGLSSTAWTVFSSYFFHARATTDGESPYRAKYVTALRSPAILRKSSPIFFALSGLIPFIEESCPGSFSIISSVLLPNAVTMRFAIAGPIPAITPEPKNFRTALSVFGRLRSQTSALNCLPYFGELMYSPSRVRLSPSRTSPRLPTTVTSSPPQSRSTTM